MNFSAVFEVQIASSFAQKLSASRGEEQVSNFFFPSLLCPPTRTGEKTDLASCEKLCALHFQKE